MPQTGPTDAHVAAVLNDLLKLDHDAVAAYALAIRGLRDPLHRETLEAFRADHERHIADLAPLIEAYGGVPIQMPHVPTGQFKLAVQAAGNAGGERAVLMAFRANERQVRDKYLRLSEEELPRGVAEVVARNAADEVKHYAWASEAMEMMGAGRDTRVGRAEDAFEQAHARAADAMEAVDRTAIEQMHRAAGHPLRGWPGTLRRPAGRGGAPRPCLARDDSRPGAGRRARAAQDDALTDPVAVSLEPRGGRRWRRVSWRGSVWR